MPREVTNMNLEEAHRLLEEPLQPETDWPEPSDPLDFAGSERDRRAGTAGTADRENGSGL